MSRPGQLIVVEGPDGVGKSTFTSALVERLREIGVPCQTYAFPGNEPGTLGALVYRLHHAPEALGVSDMAPLPLQTLHVAAHLDAIERVFRLQLSMGENIVLDRYWWSTWVYGAVGGIDRDTLDSLIDVERHCWGTVRPLVAFLIDRTRPWRESEDTAVWRLLAQEYRDLARRERGQHPVEVISSDGSPQQIATEMADVIAGMLGRPVPEDRSGGGLSEPQMHLDLGAGTQSQPRLAPPLSIGRIKGLKPTKVFDTYWHFAVERQEVFFRRLEGAPPPWSENPILQRHRFTNAYRASDRVSQYLIRHVQYADDSGAEDLFFRTILFKLFNRIETWELLERSLGGVHVHDFKPERYERVLQRAMQAGQRIYSAAYIMPAARGAPGRAKHVGHLRLLARMLRDQLPQRLSETRSLRQAFELIRAYPMMGDFLAFQYVIDLNYSRLLSFSEMEFVVPGPGARSGLRKCFRDLGGLSEADVIRLITEGQSEEFARRGLAFRDLWGRPLQLIDCQNLFCEVDKYARVAHPDVSDANGRTRIKQVFRPSVRPSWPWYPPRWGINRRIQDQAEAVHARDRG